MAYEGRLAIVAGGLGGLGTATAKLLHHHGAKLALLHHPLETPRKPSILTATFGSDSPPDITTYECDITSEDSVAKAFADLSRDLSLDDNVTAAVPSILINAAGYVSVQSILATPAEEARRTMDINLLGPYIVCREWFKLYSACVDRLQQQQSGQLIPPGRIVSISSQAAHVALPEHAAYCASKAALNGLTRSMALEWGPHNVTANTISPTVVLTELGKRAWADERKRKAMMDEIPTGRFAVPEEIAEAVEFLCGDGSGMINGADLRVDGGFSIR